MLVWRNLGEKGAYQYVDVKTVAEGVKVMDTLAKYDEFQYENKIKPDYANAGGLQMCDPEQPSEGWVDWYDEKTGEDNPQLWLANQANSEVEEAV